MPPMLETLLAPEDTLQVTLLFPPTAATTVIPLVEGDEVDDDDDDDWSNEEVADVGAAEVIMVKDVVSITKYYIAIKKIDNGWESFFKVVTDGKRERDVFFFWLKVVIYLTVGDDDVMWSGNG